MHRRLAGRVAVVAAAGAVLVGCSSAVEVPDVVGLGAADAVTALEEAGLETDYRGGAPDTRQIDHWSVTAQDPKAGEVGEGEPVLLWVTTRMREAVHACDVSVEATDGGTSLVLDAEGEKDIWGEDLVTLDDTACILNELDVPTSVIAQMDATRALDGMQDASWDGVEASWTYHPDDGLDVILELTD